MGDSAAQLAYECFVDEWLDKRDFVVVHTSGSTGKPKLINLLKSDMRRSARAFAMQFGLKPESILASALPISSIATKMAIVRHLEAGCRYVPLPVSNEFEIPCFVDVLSIGPSQACQFIRRPELRKQTGTLFIGGAPLHPEMLRSLTDAGYNVCLSYGMTETCSNVALSYGADGIYRANPGISFASDSRGCLVINAPDYSFSGTVTNDVVEIIDSRTFRWLGRYDNVVNSGGIKLYPEEIELMLTDYIASPFYITGRPHPLWGEALAVVVEGNDKDARAAAYALKRFPDGVRRPKSTVAVSRFQKTRTGKVIRILPETGNFFDV